MWNLLPWIISCVVELKGGGAIETGMIGASQALDDKVSHNHVVTRWPIEGSSSRTKVLIRPGCPSKNMDPGGEAAERLQGAMVSWCWRPHVTPTQDLP
jgi:hypothetical protein